MNEASPNRWRTWVCCAVPVLALIHGIWFLGTGPVDDDYIIYRYARHLVQGHGLVFNVGERIEGYTAPLWVLLHAGWQALGGDSPGFSVGAGLVGWIAAVAWLSRRAWKQGFWPWEALVVAAAPALAWHAVAGLGTTLAGLCLLGAWLRFAEAPWQSGLWLALAVGLRQEFALFLVPIVLGYGWRARLSVWVPAAACLGAWQIFRLAYYGRWLPTTYTTKKLPVVEDLGYGVQYLYDATWNLGWPMLLALAVWGAWTSGGRAAKAFAAGLVLHTAYVIWVGGDFMVLSRFFVPTFPLLVALAWIPLREHRRWAALTAVCLALAMQWSQIGVAWTAAGVPEEARSVRRLQQLGFKQRWARLGEHFHRLAGPDTKVALSPIGAFGWTSDLPIVDILGLTNASTEGVAPDLDTHVKGHHRSNVAWVLDQNPDYVILGNGVRDQAGRFIICPWEKGFFESIQSGGRFPKLYRQASMDVGDGMPLDVFIRRDLELPTATQWVGP